ncbi:efflux RND transporter periplasmic adaptor subunit [Desulfolutivibrio sulfoxidireducens]|uniref:efflux RND transporter periplasmic adaptor subunit n=1 Tax=Desulfolutivibrio sulfoxidireducens TaxID=2773299 RepID=UPI00159E16D8|nr:efflux RND transporter periplasmic adaptor subunit [Desulfolutivibrio sulfoxidireducens]QLA16542.1 biotin/lipoyl-binding protein [Desulfolutivibrio sulfoxidireducens]QLA19576.1 biotin/lipoyl-binding protein [Desulfolutivibrio sulfoxidireducens]
MRFTNKLLIFISLAGLALAVVVGVYSNPTPPKPEPVALPAQAPFATYIGGGGIVEPRSEIIAIGASLDGIVTTVFVKPGDRVKAGDPLFLVDDREARAELAVKRAGLAAAKAAVEEAKASHKDYATQYALVRDVADNRAVSTDDREQRKNAELLAKAKVESAMVAVESAQAELDAASTALDRLTVRAPIDGEVLQVNIRAGEYAATGVLDTPLVRLGDVDTLHVRADIDENDAWRFTPGTRAVAFIRGNRELKAEMRFVRVEPYVVSKTQLAGTSTERVDTRVLQVLFSLDRDALPVYVGQQMDVFIETPSAATAPGTGGGK